MSDSLQLYGLQPTRLLCPWYSPGKKTGVGCHALLQGSPRPRDPTHISYVSRIGKQVPSHQCHLGVQLINNAVLVSGVQQSDSVIDIHIFILFQILFSYRLSQNVEQSSLSYVQQVLLDYLFCIQWCVHVHPKFLIFPSSPYL